MAKTFFGKLLAAIGSIFSHVFKGAKKTFDSLTPEQKAALLHGSGIIDLINTEVGKLPAEIQAAILEKYPDLDLESLKAGLFQIAIAFNLKVDENSLEDIIAKLQTYLSSLKGKVWDGITHAAASLLAIFLAPPETKFAAIASLMEYVYQTFFKKK